jgi:hypothetical protein
MDQYLQNHIGIDACRQIVRHHAQASRQAILEEPCGKWLHDIKEAEQKKSQDHMKHRRRDQKEAPLEPCDLIDDNAPGILLTEQLLRLLRNMPGEAGKGDNRDQPESPGQG